MNRPVLPSAPGPVTVVARLIAILGYRMYHSGQLT